MALRAYREDSGRPPLRQLVRISRHLRTHYSPPDDFPCSLAEMSLTAVSEILAGKRKHPPTLDWTASFVLSCQRWAVEQEIIRYDPGTAILAAWSAILTRHMTGTSSGPRPAHAADSTNPAGTGQLPRWQLTADQRDFIASHGPYGQVLLARAQQGHPDARYRAALLLATDRARTSEAETLLLDAVAAGHAPSLALLDANPRDLPPIAAADRAHALACAARARGADDEDLAFCRAAARGGLPGAAFEYAQILLARNGDSEAAAWLAALIILPAIGRHRHDQA